MYRTVAGVLFLACLSTCASPAIGQTADDAAAAKFKVELFRTAMNLGIPRSEVNRWGGRIGEDEVTLEVATALQVDDVYRDWLQDAEDEEGRQYVLSVVAQHAAKYARADLALQTLQQLDDSSKKLDVLLRVAFVLGYEEREM